MTIRTLTLGALFAAGTVALTAYQQPQQPAGPKVVEAQKVKDNLYMLTGNGGLYFRSTYYWDRKASALAYDSRWPRWPQGQGRASGA